MDSQNLEKIVIVGGCGHVGLPLGIVLADLGHETTLYDISEQKVQQVNRGEMPFIEEGADDVLKKVVSGEKLKASLDPACIEKSDVVILTTGTPVDEYLNPKVDEITSLVENLAPRFQAGQTVILRSTLYPGTTRIVGELLKEKASGVSLAFCPERIAEGKAMTELKVLPQIISGLDDRALSVSRGIFGRMNGEKTVELDTVEAELAKLFCNTWRYINFAMSNEFYSISTRAGADFHRIREAVVQDYPRMKSFAGSGLAAGPCLFKDTMQLAAFSKNSFFLGHAAMLTNEGMPAILVSELESKMGGDLRGKTISVLGMTFKRDSDDTRDSLSFKLYKQLTLKGAKVICNDPYLKSEDWPKLNLVEQSEALKAEGMIVGTPHSQYDGTKITGNQKVVDVWGVTR